VSLNQNNVKKQTNGQFKYSQKYIYITQTNKYHKFAARSAMPFIYTIK